VQHTLQGAATAHPILTGFDENAELRGVRHRDGNFDVTAKGISASKPSS